jgi:acyl-coenzyme A thioesterase PaaI-like protein
MKQKSFQDYYDDDVSHCYGCGRLNKHGLQIKSFWANDQAISIYYPKPYHTAIPGYVYGGLIASLIDCHSTGTAAAAKYRHEGREMGTEPILRFLTASLHVDYLKPTPIEGPLELRSTITEIKDRKVVVETDLSVGGEVCAKGRVVAVLAPSIFLKRPA